MALPYISVLLAVLVLPWVTLTAAEPAAEPAASQALPGCQEKCGDVTIPYPFGIAEGCYRDHLFQVNCSDSTRPAKAIKGNVEIMNISIEKGEIRVRAHVAKNCYNERGQESTNLPEKFNLGRVTTFSNKRNKFTVVGCDTYAYIKGLVGDTYSSGCISLCKTLKSVINGSCSGIGCCQTSIPKGLKRIKVTAHSFNSHTEVWGFNPCSYGFLVEERSYNFSKPDLFDFQGRASVPVILDWVIDNITCKAAKQNMTSYACKLNSYCYDVDNGPGYRCNCSDGFQGNPYLKEGCVDVNECEKHELNDCAKICTNRIGSYNCSCPTGYHGDGRKGGNGCTVHKNNEGLLFIKVTAGTGVTILALVVGCFWLQWRIRKRSINRLRKKFFEQNGGLVLEQHLGARGSEETSRIYTIKELQEATNNFDESRVIGQGGFGTVYKGVLPNNKILAIKKSKVVDQTQVDQFVNEFIVLSKINHRNVVKLLGCCLETEVPLLVYEFITNGTLSHHIHHERGASISWEIRVRIATETAGALAYLHSAASPPIIHRDVKSTNILMDDNFTAKVSDFGNSRLVPMDQTQVTTLVKGTLGYLDPEYFHSGQLTEKSDVYSFGVVLVELLTGLTAISFNRHEKARNLAAYFTSSLKENQLFQISDIRVTNHANAEQVQEVAKLAESCLRLKGEERPTMKEIAMELEGLRRMVEHKFIGDEMKSEETEQLLDKSMDLCSTSTTVEFDSLKNRSVLKFQIDGGR